MNPDRRVAEVMANSRDVRLTWDRALMGLDLAEMNARAGGWWSCGRLRPQRSLNRQWREEKKK